MASRSSSGSAMLLAIATAAIAGAVWWWRATVFQSHQTALQTEHWEQVKEEYPVGDDRQETPERASKTAELVVQANPFSPKRRLEPPKPETATAAAGLDGTPLPAAPKFVFKGIIKLGTRQRAIVEDATTNKTYFLEVGQEVEKFKVLDITETRVVLSDPQTKEEVTLSLTNTMSP